MKTVKLKLLEENAIIPTKANPSDACYDVVATSKEYIDEDRIKYGLGFSIELPEFTQLDIRARSSIHKTGLILSNCIGTGDEDYRGEYMVVFYHVVKSLPTYEIGDRVAQIQVRNREDTKFEVSFELSETERGEGGFGSTGNGKLPNNDLIF